MLGWTVPALLLYAGIIVVLVLLFLRLPTAFLPEEDQGIVLTQITLPVGATQSRTLAVAKEVEHHYMVDEQKNVETTFIVAGFSFAGAGQNSGIASCICGPGTSAPARPITHLPSYSARWGASRNTATPWSSRWCRRRCRSSASPPASTSRWRTAAISAMTG